MDTLFYFFAALTLVASVLVVLSHNPIRSAMSMIAALVGVAALFFLLEAPFLGVLQVLIHAGAVMVLFLFLILLLDVKRDVVQPVTWRRIAQGLAAFVLFAGALLWLVNASEHLPGPESKASVTVSLSQPNPEAPAQYVSGAKGYGELLFSKYMLPAQVVGLLLLVAMVGVVSLAMRRRE